jgi:saccharopine dehydrogenase-like NADP-dependent oxidoreductase
VIITLLGGAGLMGAGIVRDLVSDRLIIDISEIRVADASRSRMAALAAELGDKRITLVDLDVTDPERLSGVISGSAIVINCVPTLLGYQMAIFEAALESRVPYMDLGGLGVYTVKQLAEHERFRKAGVTAVLGAGSDPGMSNMLCRAVADELDEIDKINLYWAAEFVGPENPVLVPPYSVSTVLAEYAQPSTQFYDGVHVECPPMSGSEWLDLPQPWGRCEFMHSPHSEQLTVPLADGIRDKGIREFTWKLHLPHREHEAWIGLVKAGFGNFAEPVDINGVAVTPLDVLNKVIERNIARSADRMPSQECHDIHFAIGVGRRNGKPARVRAQVIVHPDPIYKPYLDPATSMNASIAAQLILAHPRKAGVYAPEAYFDVRHYAAELRKRKFNLEVDHL